MLLNLSMFRSFDKLQTNRLPCQAINACTCDRYQRGLNLIIDIAHKGPRIGVVDPALLGLSVHRVHLVVSGLERVD